MTGRSDFKWVSLFNLDPSEITPPTRSDCHITTVSFDDNVTGGALVPGGQRLAAAGDGVTEGGGWARPTQTAANSIVVPDWARNDVITKNHGEVLLLYMLKLSHFLISFFRISEVMYPGRSQTRTGWI